MNQTTSRAAAVVQNALIARLVMLIARAYSRPKDGDLHLRVAAESLEKNNLVRQIFATGEGATKRVTDFEAYWLKCRDDHRRIRIKSNRREECPNAKQNGQIRLSKTTRMVWNARRHPPLPFGLPGNPENRYHSSQLGDHPGNPGLQPYHPLRTQPMSESGPEAGIDGPNLL
jgi:hypothetical protein